MIPNMKPLNEFYIDQLSVAFEHSDFTIFKDEDATLRNYYIYYPAIDKSSYIGPFFTRNGAIKYAYNRKIDVDFGDFE